MQKAERLVKELEKHGILPSGLNMPFDVNVLDVRACKYDFGGFKFGEADEYHENVLLSIEMTHKSVDKSFWINIFEGTQKRKKDVRVITATFKETVNSSGAHIMEYGALYEDDCISKKDIDGVDSIKEILTAFDYRLFTNDEAGLYDFGEGPTSESNSDYLKDTVDAINNILFIDINKKISKFEPKPEELNELYRLLNEIAAGKLYQVSVVVENSVLLIHKYLQKEEAEKMFVRFCNKYYNEDGLSVYANRRGKTSDKLTIEELQEYFHSEVYYDVNDLSNVEINLM